MFIPTLVFSEPYMANRGITIGLKCSSCHVNRTGGGLRTGMGAVYGTTVLPWKKVEIKSHVWNLLDGLVALGGDIRFLNQSTFIRENTANTFQTDKANVYVSFQLIPRRVSFYLDESLQGGAQSREIFGLLENLPANGWIKAGKFILPYGTRLEDDRAFIREVTGFNYNTPDVGVEIGLEPGRWTIIGSLTNGTAGSLDNNVSKQVIGSLAYISDAFRLGLSGALNPGRGGKKNSAALWGGFRFRKFVLLAEVDVIHDEIEMAQTRNQIVTHAEINYLVHEGWNIKAGYEYFDPDLDIRENQRDRIVLAVEPFIAPFVQLAFFYRFNQSIPQNIPQNADELIFRIHLYF